MLSRRPRSMRAVLTLVLAPLLACGVLTATLVAGPASPASAGLPTRDDAAPGPLGRTWAGQAIRR